MIFVVTHMIPTDPATVMLGDKATPQVIRAFRQRWGLDRSVYEQYALYMRNLARGDLGVSIRSGQPVTADIADHLPATVELAVAAMLFSSIVGTSLGICAALTRGRWLDGIIRLTSLAGVSAPVFWTGVLLIVTLFYYLQWFPSGGRLSLTLEPPPHITGLYTVDSLLDGNWRLFIDSVKHLILPAISLGAYYMALFVRLARSSLIEEFQTDYFRTARAKGLTTERVLVHHALRNALVPIISYSGIAFGGLLSGAVVTETIFSWPGLGRYAFENALTFDFPAIMGVTLIIGLMYVAVNFMVDVLQVVADPRLRDTL